jgi:TRAP-type C4-dicarboxylate transport system substrate-binding protein
MRPNRVVPAVLAALAVAGCGASGADKAGGNRASKPTVLTLANVTGEGTELQPFVDAAVKRSGGTLEIRIQSYWRRGQAAAEPGLIRDVNAGKADLGWASPRAFDDVGVTAFDALIAPLLVDSLPLERAVLQSPLAGQMLESLEPAGVTGLGILPGPLRRPLGVGRLVKPQDYEGREIALARSQVGARTLKALGARGAWLPATGSIEGYDGVEQQIASIAGNRYDKTASHLTANVALWPRPVVLFANPKVLASLTGRQRDALTRAAKDAFEPTFQLQQKDEDEGTAILCRRGVTFEAGDNAELAALRQAVQPVYDELGRDAGTKAAIAQIAAMRADAGKESAPACAAADPTEEEAATGATAVDGVYRTDLTLEQIRRAPGFGAGEDNPSNVGHLKLELAKGKFRLTGAKDGTEVNGTYALSGDDLAIEFNGEGPFHYRWSVYRGALTLRKRGGGPTGLAVHPWRREDARSSVGSRSVLDGVWQMNASREEVVNEVVRRQSVSKASARADLASENWGVWRFRFDRGQLYYTQAAEGHKRWTRARYTVKDHTLTFTVTSYGGDAPNGAAEKDGEKFSFRWSRYRDRLTLSPVPYAISPENFTADDWRKVG